MARTPLMQHLVKLARDHTVAKQRGISLEQLRDEDRQLLSRRGAMLGTAAAAAGLALPRRAFAAPSKPPPSGGTIAIVGGGVAGLAAALSLKDSGYASTVYESSGRIGGRMFSNTGYFNEGQVSEWGGELIDSGHKTIQALARRYNLTLDNLIQAEPSGSEDTYQFGSVYYPKDQADADFQAVHNVLQGDVQAASYPTTVDISTEWGRYLDSISVYEWIENNVAGGHTSPMGKLLDVAYNIEYGAETTDQSSLNLVYLLGYQPTPGNFKIFGKSDERYHIRGGNQQIPAAMAAELGSSTIKTGWRLVKIAKNADGTTQLTFQVGSKTNVVNADHTVLALPFAVLRTIDFAGAGFAAWKTQAINTMGAGKNAKINTQFSSRLWNGPGPWGPSSNGASFADTGYQNTWEVSRAQPGTSGILVAYSGGNVSAALKSTLPWANSGNSLVDADTKAMLAQLEPVYPGITAKWNGKSAESKPFLDPNLKLAYSYWKVGQYQTIAGNEKKPQGNIHFAGEHCSIDFQGYMEGGASEGQRAATEVLDAITGGTSTVAAFDAVAP